MKAMRIRLACLVMGCLALSVASCSKNGSSGASTEDDSSQTTSESNDDSLATDETATSTASDSVTETGQATDTGLETDTQSLSDTQGTDSDSDSGSDTESESETEVIMSLMDVIPPAASREVTTEVKVLGYGILEGAAVSLTNCDTGDVIDGTSWSTVAEDGESFSLVLPADPQRDQGLYTITVINAPPMEHQSDDLVCALSILSGVPPTVTTVTPATAFVGVPGDGVLSDTLITIEGTGFAATPEVRWVSTDGSEFWEAHEVAFIADTLLTAVVPSESGKMPVGDYHVYVTNPDKLGARWLVSEEEPGIFSVNDMAPPRISDIQPPRVEIGSCTSQLLTITGTGFDASAEVFYMMESGTCAGEVMDANGNILCPMVVNSSNASELVARFGACPGNGLWPIVVMNPDGQTDTFFSILITNSSAGHLNSGDFERIKARLEQGRWRHVSEYGFDSLGRAHIYVAGGQDSGGAVLDTVETSELNIFGRPGPFGTAMQYLNEENPRVTNTLSIPRQGAAMVRVGKDLFVLGGASTRTDVVDDLPATDSVERARILGYEQMPSVQKPSFVKGAGQLPEGTWFYRVSALGPWGEGLATKEMSVYQGGGEITVCWGEPAVSGATGYNVYRSAAADGRSGTASLIAVNVQGTCFADDGIEELAPAPARLRGAPAVGAGVAVGTHRYVVTAVVPISGGTSMETVGSYAASIELRQDDVDAGNAALALNWDAVPGTGVTYHLYRYDAGSGQYLRLSEQPLAATTFLDTGLAPLEPPALLAQPVRPLPSGSLSLWTELDAGQFLLSPREGVEAVVIHLDAENADDPVARILAVGGRSASGSIAASYLATAESIAVYADGSLATAWEWEAPVLNVPRSHYALLTTQGRDTTDFPPEGEDPPCPDFDGDGYIDCACADPNDPYADCDDNDPLVHPGATEICGDGIDQDCDGLGCAGSDLPCLCDDDLDGDGHVSVACGGDDCCDSGLEEGVLGCSPETAASIHGGAVDVCGDGIDQNCDGIDPECLCDDDLDGDGHLSVACGGDDCCDSGSDTSLGCTGATASSIHPGASEICGDGVDQNCDGVDDPCIPVSGSWLRPMTRPSVFDQDRGIRVPRTLKGGETVYIIAVMGDSDWSDVGNSGVKSFEACKVDQNGRLVGKDGLWHTQKLQSNQGTFGHGAVLYYDYLFAFWGAKTESYTPESSRALIGAAMQRYSVAEAGDVVLGKEDELLTGSQSASAFFEVIRSHYKMLRLMSYIYVIGGWADAHTDIDGNPVPAGPTGEMERHVQ